MSNPDARDRLTSPTMTDFDLPAALQRALYPSQGQEHDAPCLDDDTLAALAEGRLDAGQRAEVLPHLATCERCRVAVASIANALADSAVDREIRAVRGPTRRLLRVTVPLAAAAALVLLLWAPSENGPPVHRAPPTTGVQAPIPLSPLGTVARVERLYWTAVPGADRYRVTLFEASGRVRFEAQFVDSMAVLPDSVGLAASRTYLWKVEARIGFDRWSGSELVVFRVAPESQ